MSNVQALQSHAFPVYEVFSCEIPEPTVRGFMNKTNQPTSFKPRQNPQQRHPPRPTSAEANSTTSISPNSSRHPCAALRKPWNNGGGVGGVEVGGGKWCMEGWLLVLFGLVLFGVVWFGLVWLIDHHRSPTEIIHHWSIHSVPIDTKKRRTPTSKTHSVWKTVTPHFHPHPSHNSKLNHHFPHQKNCSSPNKRCASASSKPSLKSSKAAPETEKYLVLSMSWWEYCWWFWWYWTYFLVWKKKSWNHMQK